jgi:hypothetical protein
LVSLSEQRGENAAGERERSLAAVQFAAARSDCATLRALGRVCPAVSGSFPFVSPFAKPRFRDGGDESVV